EDASEHIILCRAWYKKAWDWSKEKAKRGCKELKKGIDETEKFLRKKVIHGTEKFFKKDVTHFVKENKTECIIGGVIVAAILCKEIICLYMAAEAAKRLIQEALKAATAEKNRQRDKKPHETVPVPHPLASFFEQMEREEIPDTIYKAFKP